MKPERESVIDQAFLDSIQPIVLVGGKSRRFGRDKLQEPIGANRLPLVQHSIDVLREVFGRRVKLVGECHADVLPLADGVIVDRHPGIGPIGGIASALHHCPGSIFVLAGDMPSFCADSARKIIAAAQASPWALAVFASTDRPHPCAGLYAQAALATLAARIANENYKLTGALTTEQVIEVSCEVSALANINSPHDCAFHPMTAQ